MDAQNPRRIQEQPLQGRFIHLGTDKNPCVVSLQTRADKQLEEGSKRPSCTVLVMLRSKVLQWGTI